MYIWSFGLHVAHLHVLSVHANVYVSHLLSAAISADLLSVILILAQVIGSVILITILEHYFSEPFVSIECSF
jgi:hypothetical protein